MLDMAKGKKRELRGRERGMVQNAVQRHTDRGRGKGEAWQTYPPTVPVRFQSL